MAFLHGISVTEVTPQARLVATVATATIGLVATAPAANAAAFPLNRPVLVSEGTGGLTIADAIVAAGDTGTLRQVLQAIAGKVRAPIVVVRVAPGANADATETAVIGADVAGVRTGMQALLTAAGRVSVKPRIIGAPGLETADVIQALATLGGKLRAMAYARALGDDVATVRTFREGFTSRELMLIHPDFTTRDAAGVVAPSFVAAHALGMRALIDQAQGWNKTLSNVPVPGVVGTSRDIGFDLQDPDCDANLLNAADVTTIVPIAGELRFWGSRTCAGAGQADFVFESATRTAHILADTLAEGMVWALDKPLRPSLARDIVERINEKLREETRAGRILGATAFFDPARNIAADLKVGKLAISYRYTPTPPLEQLGLFQEITDEFLADFSTQVVSG